MSSPIPGMNPYLEQDDSWEDFHHDFISRTREVLSAMVGANYFVKVEVRLYVHELSSEDKHFTGRADVGVTAGPGMGTLTTASSVSAPIKLPFPKVDIERYSWLEIRDRRSRKVVTVIELLSPTNKTPGPDRDDYLQKRALLLFGPSSFIEIDLRRGGKRPESPVLPACDYYVLLSRAYDRSNLDIWPIGLRNRLPVIAVPLTPPDAEISLDVQAVLDRTYDAAQYGKYIYAETPDPPLSPEDDAWAKQILAEKR